jgi:hypothetical protein
MTSVEVTIIVVCKTPKNLSARAEICWLSTRYPNPPKLANFNESEYTFHSKNDRPSQVYSNM